MIEVVNRQRVMPMDCERGRAFAEEHFRIGHVTDRFEAVLAGAVENRRVTSSS